MIERPKWTKRTPPGEEPPAVPESLATWVSQTTYGTLFGFIYGGYSQLQVAQKESPSKVTRDIADGVYQSRRHRLAAHFVEGGILTGARLGLFASTISAGALACQAARGDIKDAWNSAIAAGATCGTAGYGYGGWRFGFVGCSFGFVSGASLGFVQQQLEMVANREREKTNLREYGTKEAPSEESRVEEQDVAETVAWLEGSRETIAKALEGIAPAASAHDRASAESVDDRQR